MKGLKEFEHISIFRGDLEDYTREIEEITKQIKNIESVDNMGFKTLAYEIKGNKKGYYIEFLFKGTSSDVNKLEKYCKLNNNILKFLTVECPE